MTKLDNHIGGLFRRGLPQGDQFDLLVTWIATKLIDGEDASGAKLMQALGDIMSRTTPRLSKLIDR